MAEPILSNELLLWCDGLVTHRKLGKIESVRDFVRHIAKLEQQLASLQQRVETLERERVAFYEALTQEDSRAVQRVTEGILLRREQALATTQDNAR